MLFKEGLWEMDDTERASLGLRAVTATTAAMVALQDPTTGMVVAGAVPILDEMQSRWFHRERQKLGHVIEVGMDQTGLSPDDFLKELTKDDLRLALLAESLSAASRTAVNEKIQALGVALATGALTDDDARLDEERVWVQILAEVEAPHLRVLYILNVDKPANESHFTWLYDQTGRAINALSTDSAVIRERMLNTIERQGLIQRKYGDELPASYDLRGGASASDRFLLITEAGRAVLDRFSDAGSTRY